MGGVCLGVVAVGGVPLSLLLSLGGLAVSLLVACGGLAVGAIAVGGCAVGLAAVGGLAVGYYAAGGEAFGVHTISETARDPAAVAFFQKWAPAVLNARPVGFR